MVVESTDSANTHQPSKLRVPGSIPGAPTTKPLKTHGEEKTAPVSVEDVPSADQGLSGVKLRNNCGSQPPSAPAWRSMASAPRDGRRCVLLIGRIADTPIMRVGYLTGSGCHWSTDNGMLWSFYEVRAWAPIPEWTGEVAE